MARKIQVIMVAAILALFHSCIDLGIHISAFPLDKPGPAVSGLTGTWQKTEDTESGTGIDSLEIIRFNRSEYVIRSLGDSEANLLRGYATEISGHWFLNIHELTEEKKEYVFCRLHLPDENTLILEFVADQLFKDAPPSNSKNLRKLIQKNLKNPALFNKEMSFSFRKTMNR